MKVVAVSQRIDFLTERNEKRDSIDCQLNIFLDIAGYLAVPVPNTLVKITPKGRLLTKKKLDMWFSKIKPEALVISGGNNLGQFVERDQTEISLLDIAVENKLPVLGICRGMQIMAMWAGTGLIKISNHTNIKHRISGKINGLANSYHDYALTSCPKGFIVLSKSIDGVIEAIRHEKLPWIGLMWHPERENKPKIRDLRLVEKFFP